MTDGRVLGINATVEEILRVAYAPDEALNPNRIILKANLPKDKYDFLSNTPERPKEALQQEIKRKFGVLGRLETVETGVLLLTVKYPNAAGLRPNLSKTGSADSGDGHMWIVGGSMNNLARDLETHGFKIPIINQTGLTDNFDFKIRWKSLDDLKQALLDRLGLELVPSREPIEMLVVEKVK